MYVLWEAQQASAWLPWALAHYALKGVCFGDVCLGGGASLRHEAKLGFMDGHGHLACCTVPILVYKMQKKSAVLGHVCPDTNPVHIRISLALNGNMERTVDQHVEAEAFWYRL